MSESSQYQAKKSQSMERLEIRNLSVGNLEKQQVQVLTVVLGFLFELGPFSSLGSHKGNRLLSPRCSWCQNSGSVTRKDGAEGSKGWTRVVLGRRRESPRRTC